MIVFIIITSLTTGLIVLNKTRQNLVSTIKLYAYRHGSITIVLLDLIKVPRKKESLSSIYIKAIEKNPKLFISEEYDEFFMNLFDYYNDKKCKAYIDNFIA